MEYCVELRVYRHQTRLRLCILWLHVAYRQRRHHNANDLVGYGGVHKLRQQTPPPPPTRVE